MPPSHAYLAGSLAILSGYCDVICLLRFRCFAALMTGNIVHIGIAISNWRDTEELMATLMFNGAVLASHAMAVFLFCAIADCVSRPVQLAAPLLGCLTLVGGLVDGFTGNRWAACCLAASFGAMNFITSPNTVLEGRLLTMVSLATGNLQKSCKMLYKKLSGHSFSHVEVTETQIALSVVGGTFIGAVLGGFAFAYTPLVSTPYLFVPLALAQTIVLLMHDRLLRPSNSKLSPAMSSALSEPLAP